MTESAIQNAFNHAVSTDNYLTNYHSFRAGYMALLEQLNRTGSLIKGDMEAKFGEMATLVDETDDSTKYWENRGYELVPVYLLPEGIEK